MTRTPALSADPSSGLPTAPSSLSSPSAPSAPSARTPDGARGPAASPRPTRAVPAWQPPLLRLVAAVQLVLGVLYLAAPHWLLAQMGHHPVAPDIAYPLAMLAARFLAYGLGLWWAARDPARHAPWVRLMALIQLIDLGAGLVYTASGVVPLALSGFPMVNAVWIAAVCWRAGAQPRLDAGAAGAAAA